MGYGFLLQKPKNIISGETPWEPTGEIYGVDILRFTSNPTNRINYIDDAVDSIPARGNEGNFLYGSWENRFPFNRIRPCLMDNGVVNGYLNKNNFNYFEDGTIADITNGTKGDVMIEIPTVYYKFERKSPTKDLLVRYSDTKHDDTWVAYAHTDANGVVKDNIYISAYEASGSDTIIYSLSGQSPMTAKSADNLRLYGKNRGNGYSIIGHHQITLLQILFLVMFKSNDTYNVLGSGIQTGGKQNTGSANDKGMFYGVSDDKTSIKFMGIEDFYGNTTTVVGDLYLSSSKYIQLDGVDIAYKDTGTGITLDVFGTNMLGFIPTEVGTETSYKGLYYVGWGTSSAGRSMQFGTGSGNYSSGGVFRYTADVLTTGNSTRASRLVYV